MAERPAAAAEGPRGHEARPPVDDQAIPWRVFIAIGVFVLAMGLLYWSTAYEEGGTVMLIVAAGLSLWIGAYLWLRTRSPRSPASRAVAGEAAAAAGEAAPADDHYLPHSSTWPLLIGLGAAAVANGLVLGLWVLVPGVGVLALGIAGFIRQTRRRD